MIFRRNIVHFTDFSAQENIPTDYSSKNQSCSIVSSKPNSDYVYIITFIIISKSKHFLREIICILVPKKHLGKKFPQIAG